MRRREFIAATVCSAMLPSMARAQSQASLPRMIMYSAYESLSSMYENSYNRYIYALFAEMRRLGLVEGKSITIERYGRETPDVTSNSTIAAIVDSKPDIIFCVGTGAVFQRATRTIPIVAFTIDAVREGLVKSLSHPGGNLTGVTFEPELPIHGKRFALLREIFPALTSPAFLANSEILTYYWPAVREAADAQGMALVKCPVRLPSSEAIYREAITKAKDEGADAIMVALDVDAVVRNALVVNLIEAAGLPAIYPFTDFVVAGGLMSYSTDLVELNKRMASDIHAILNGTKPGDIPVYQPTKFELYINLKAAKALSLTVPATLLTVADMVIE